MENEKGYYSEKLSAVRLRRCYEIASPRVQRYLRAEIEYVMKKIQPGDNVLEPGCGYGRVLEFLCSKAHDVYGIDNSISSLKLAKETLRDISNCHLCLMDAVALGFRNDFFDSVLCIQNGISALGVDPHDFISECVRVCRPGGTVMLSSYSDKFWPDRLNWFNRQIQEGLLGEIDFDKTGNGVIVCKDGFKATTVSPDDFLSLVSQLGLSADIVEVDNSSVFCEILVE